MAITDNNVEAGGASHAPDGQYSENELDLIAGELAKRMIHTHDLVSLRNDGEGIFLHPDPQLFRDDNLLASAAVLPRVVFVSLFALLWVIMPVDLLPDGVPLGGVLAGLEAGNIVIDTADGRMLVPRKSAALVKPVVDMEGIEDVDLSGEEEQNTDET